MGVNKGKSTRVGRPTKWSIEKEELAFFYLANFDVLYGDAVPSIIAMGIVLEVDESTLHKWARDESTNFKFILDLCNAQQFRVLITNGLTGKYNARIVQLMLSKHGYTEKSETILTAPGSERPGLNETYDSLTQEITELMTHVAIPTIGNT